VANIILRQESDVLLVPQQALYGSFDEPVVRVMTSGGIQERPVILGNSDDFWTAVRAGLAEGDQVVMEVAQAASDPFAAFRQLRGNFGGGRGGGGFGQGGSGGRR
jgi:multidrug efflux pump subunit AcrA (membrane-fusion protein)